MPMRTSNGSTNSPIVTASKRTQKRHHGEGQSHIRRLRFRRSTERSDLVTCGDYQESVTDGDVGVRGAVLPTSSGSPWKSPVPDDSSGGGADAVNRRICSTNVEDATCNNWAGYSGVRQDRREHGGQRESTERSPMVRLLPSGHPSVIGAARDVRRRV